MIYHEYKAPSIQRSETKLKIFVGGSIEQNTAEYWQSKFIEQFNTELIDSIVGNDSEAKNKLLEKLNILPNKYLTFYNPRRDDWDSSWECDKNNKQFYEQVTWELDHLDKSDIIAIYFDPNTKSPISLMELGLYASTGKVFVCCPKGFWRKGNVDIVCEKYNIPIFEDFDTWIFRMVKRALALRLI